MHYVKPRKCLFPAAGYGTRFLPATKAMPKEMLPILNKPLIQYGVEECLDAEIRQIAFVTGRNKRAIEDHFDINYEIEHEIRGKSAEVSLKDIRRLISECTFSYTRQINIAGLGHAVLSGETLIGKEPFAVILADDLCVSDDGGGIIKNMVDVYKETGCSVVAVQKVSRSAVSDYGVISCGERIHSESHEIVKVDTLVEKPPVEDAPSDLAVIGRYILLPEIFDILRQTPPGRNGEVQLTDALRAMAKSGKLVAYNFLGTRFDCGSIDGFVAATQYFYNQYAGSRANN